MNIAILSCNTGGGHNSAAAAIKEYFDSKEIYCEIKDALAFDSRLKSEVISKGHVFLYKKAPTIFGAGYHYAEKHPSKPGSESMMYAVMKSGTEALYRYLVEAKIDAVICTHVFAAMMMTELKRTSELSVKNYFVATDYTCYPGIDEVIADAFFIAHEHLIPEYTNFGISEESIVPTGIPIKRAFYRSLAEEKAKELLDLPQDKKIVLLMCGSMGCGPIFKLSKTILKSLPEDAMLVVICGSNYKLVRKFEKIADEDKMRVVGYTNKMNLYMDAAYIVITKPGGLSSTEAATKSLPMVLMNVVAGCETRNLDFLIKNGFAVSAEKIKALADETLALLWDDLKRNQIADKLKNDFSVYSAGAIGDYMIADIAKSI
jgi:processive 1,2-diacylglycerol beta-glucosyltransferase